MRRNKMLVLLLLSVLFFFTACSSSSDDSSVPSHESSDSNNDSNFSNDFAGNNMEESAVEEEHAADAEYGEDEETEDITVDRMIIHQAHLHVKVKNLEKAQTKIEDKVNKYDGYIVESNVYRDNDEQAGGNITVRIPEEHFQNFLLDSEEIAADVLERNVTGQDVTEQYVDLESRIKSKRAVEERLLEFMKDAEKTEDLLKISSDLSAVQEDIEVIVGKMNFLENQTSYATIDISMTEDRVVIPELDSKDLDTWEKTKKQLTKSVNFILAAASGLIVFFIGNLPVIIILAVIGIGIYLFTKRYTRNVDDENK